MAISPSIFDIGLNRSVCNTDDPFNIFDVEFRGSKLDRPLNVFNRGLRRSSVELYNSSFRAILEVRRSSGDLDIPRPGRNDPSFSSLFDLAIALTVEEQHAKTDRIVAQRWRLV
ncbi:MAG: hypothetical protein JXB05_23910 [Myxococcaceae bacterium]|nr:hypothetical protein [Myxococcaceae bacterium]